MAKKIRIIPWLDESQLNNQLKNIGKRKQKIKVDIDSSGVDNIEQSMNRLARTTNNTNSVFGKLKNTISNTFSTSRLTMTSFLLVLNEINKAGKEAKKTIEEIDKAVTDLQIATDMSRASVENLVKGYNSYAKELKTSTTSITTAADDYLRAGKSMNESQALIKDSVMLAKLGQIGEKEATEDLLAVMNGLNLSVDETGKALDAMVAIDMKAATSAGDIATALKYCASSADVAGISFSKLAAMVGTVQSKTQLSAETVGTFFNTLLSRYKDIKIGDYLTDDGEDISDYESVLKSVGVQLRDSSGEFRSFETVLEEIINKWGSLSSVEKAALAKVQSGVRQQNRYYALMENYSEVLKLTEVAANSAGTAIDKYNNSYMNSLEARKEELKASFESMIINTNFDEVYSGIVESTTALIEFVNETNALEGAMTGIAVSSGIKAFLALRTGINEAYISLNQFANALSIVKQTNISATDFDKLLLLSNNLSTSQTKLLLSSKNLTIAQKEQILVNQGLSVAEAKLQLETWGMATTNTGLTVATTTLKNSLRGLWATMLANPIMLVTAAVSGAVMAYSSYKQKLEETRKANIEASDSAIETANNLKNLYVEYSHLTSIQNRTSSQEEEYKSIIEEITVALGERSEALKGLSQGTEEYTAKLKELTQAELEEQYTSAVVGRKSAEETLQDTIWSAMSGSKVSVDSNSKGKSLSNEAQQAVDVVSDALKEYETINQTWKNISWEITSDNPEDAINYYNALIQARTDLVNASKDNEALLNTEIYRDINNAINSMSDNLDTYISKRYEELNLDYLVRNTIPTTVDEYKKMEDTIVGVVGANEGLQTAVKDLLAEDFSELYAKVQEGMGNIDFTTETDILNTNDLIKQIDTQLKPTFEALRKSYLEIFTDKGFTLENVDVSMLSEVMKVMDEMKKAGLDIDTSAFENLANVLSDSSSEAWEVQQAFDNVATTAVNSLNPALGQCSGESYLLVQTMLESLGVMNAEQVMIDSLGYSYEEYVAAKEEATKAGFDLATATEDEINEFVQEQIESGNCGQALALLQLKKLLLNSTTINTAEDIDNILSLANAANLASDQLQNLESLKNVIANRDAAIGKDPRAVSEYNKAISALSNSSKEAILNASDVKVDFKGLENSAGKAGKKAGDTYVEQYEKALGELNDLKKQGKLSEYQYLQECRKLYEKYFRNITKYAKNFADAQADYLQGMKSLYESAFSYITKQIDKSIDSLNKQCDAQIASLEAQKEAAAKVYEDQIDAIDEQIKGIDKVIDKKQDEIDAINDAADARQREIDLQKAQYELERAQNQKVSNVYKDGQMVWTTDTSEVRDKREEVADAKREIQIAAIEDEIKGLEKQKDILEEQKEFLEEALEKSNEYWDAQIEQTEKYFDGLIAGMEDYKSQFEELSEVFENAKMEATLQELGINMDALLAGSQEEFDKLKNSYMGILADMSRSNDGMLDQLSRLGGISAESISYLESTKGAFDNLGAVSLENLSGEVDSISESASGLSESSGNISESVDAIGTSVSGVKENISPLKDELGELKQLIDDLVKLFSNLKFPEIGDENYAAKLNATASALGAISAQCERFSKIDFSSIIGTASEDEEGMGSGFKGLASTISDAVTIIQLQMTNLQIALQTGNDAFQSQIDFINNDYLPAWEDLQSRLAEIIGVGGGGDESGKGDKKGGNKKSSDKKGESESGAGDGSIIDIMQTGGEEVSAKLEDPWLSSFQDFATGENSVQSICELITEIVNEMATNIKTQCEVAAKSLRELADMALSVGSGGGSVGSSNGGGVIPINYKGTVGNAFANGTTKFVSSPQTGYNGLPKNEKNALRSEYGQPELTVYPNGKTELTTEPTMSDLPKGTVIFNEEQTKRIMNNKGKSVGNAYDDGTIVTKDGVVLRPLPADHPTMIMLKKFEKYIAEGGNMFVPPTNAMSKAAEAMDRMTTNIVKNNNMSQQTVLNIDKISLPNITNDSSATRLIEELRKLPRDTYQYANRY